MLQLQKPQLRILELLPQLRLRTLALCIAVSELLWQRG